MDAFTLVAKLTLNRSEFDQGLREVEGSMNSNETKGAFSSWGVSVGNLASDAIKKALMGAFDFAKSVFKTGMSFEAMMDEVQSVAKPTEKQFEMLNERAQELGASTKFTAEEVGEAFFYMAEAGWKTESMLGGIEAVLNLAAASGESLGSVSDIVTDALTAFGLTAEDSAHFVDVLATAASNSNTTVGMMGEAFKYLAPVAGALGYSVDDVAMALGLMANNGIKASQAGTTMRQILSNLISPTEAAENAMANLGLSLYNADGSIKSLQDLMVDMRNAFNKSGFDVNGTQVKELQDQFDALADAYETGKITLEDFNQQKMEMLAENGTNAQFLKEVSDIAGVRGISAFLAIMKTTDEDWTKLNQSIENSNGTAKKMSDIMLDNLKGDVTFLQSAIDGLKLAMFEEVNPMAREFVQTLTDGVTAITNLVKHGKLTWTVEDEEQEAINDAERNAIEASGLVDYMDSLIGKYGEAASESAGWADAMERLERLIPGITQQIQAEGQALDETTASLRRNIEESKNKAIEDAKRATLAKYTEQYNEAQAALGQAQIDQYTAESIAGAAWADLVKYVRKTQGASFTGQNMTFEQLESAAYATANELGESTEYIKTLSESYKTQTQIAEANKKSIEELTLTVNRYKTQLDIAKRAVEQMVRDMQSSVSSTTMTYGQWANNYYSQHSHAKGDWYIPYDDYPAMLHRGEMVLTASQARQFREGSGSSLDVSGLVTAIVGAMQDGLRNAHVDAYLDGRKITDEVARRMNNQLALAR